MDNATPRFNLWAPEARKDPFPIYDAMRREAPVARFIEPYQNLPMWIISRYDDVVAMLRDSRFVNDIRKLDEASQQRYAPLISEQLERLQRSMLTSDPPDHSRLRSLVAKGFTPRRIEGLRPRILELTQQLLDQAADRGEMDLIADFAFPLPITVIAELLGISAADREQFRAWTLALITPPPDGNMDPMNQAAQEFIDYFEALFVDRRKQPGNDLISALLEVEEAGDRLTGNELLSMTFLLLVAGHETTVNLIGNGMLTLFQHPDQLAKLRERPELIDTAVEEMLRYCGPVEFGAPRFCVKDTEFGGHVIPAGEFVMGLFPSANRDPAQFDDPDRFDIERSPNKHIAFGVGIHFCLGAPLARIEAPVAIANLLERFPNLRLNVDPEALEWRPAPGIRALDRLPVSF